MLVAVIAMAGAYQREKKNAENAQNEAVALAENDWVEPETDTTSTGDETQETMAGAVPNAMALEEMRQYLEIRERQHMTITMAEIQKRYQSAPYGWREIDIAALTAALVRGQKIQLMYGGALLSPTDRKTVDCLRKRTETEKTVVRQKVSAPDILVKKARQLAGELLDLMDLPSDEENLCGKLIVLLADEKNKNEGLLKLYSSTIAYPGKAVIEKGQTVLNGVLAHRNDNVAFLEAFAKAEDDLLDWSEDRREVEFFFKNQRHIFDAAWKLCEKLQRERHYFAEEEGALSAADTMQQIFKSDKPYRRIAELPTLQQTITQAYERINAARRERVQEIIVQSRGDIHTLAANEPGLRETVRKADEELERRKQEALSATSPTLLDASITQILTYKDAVCRKMEQLIASRQEEGEVKKMRVATLRRYDVLPQKRLTSPGEVDDYVNVLRAKLMEALKNNDAIQLN